MVVVVVDDSVAVVVVVVVVVGVVVVVVICVNCYFLCGCSFFTKWFHKLFIFDYIYVYI